MAEWVNKGIFSRGLAHTQCLRRDFVTEFLLWGLARAYGYAMSLSRICHGFFSQITHFEQNILEGRLYEIIGHVFPLCNT